VHIGSSLVASSGDHLTPLFITTKRDVPLAALVAPPGGIGMSIIKDA